MKKNPFYGMSAAAMLLGCYLLNHALELEPGRLGKLLVLMGVLQVYEGLLVALGVFLVTGVVGGFVFLALGAWHSLRGDAASPPPGARAP